MAEQTVADFEAQMEAMELNKALKTVWAFISRMNKYIDETMPWVLAKSSDETDIRRLQSVMYHLAESLRIICRSRKPCYSSGGLQKFWGTVGA